MPTFEVFEFELDTGEVVVGVEVPIEPYGTVLLRGEDNGMDATRLLREVTHKWKRLWPTMRKMLQKCIASLDSPIVIEQDTHLANVARTDPEAFMGDKSDIHVSFEFVRSPELDPDIDPPSQWDYFIRDLTIVHFQPVY